MNPQHYFTRAHRLNHDAVLVGGPGALLGLGRQVRRAFGSDTRRHVSKATRRSPAAVARAAATARPRPPDIRNGTATRLAAGPQALAATRAPLTHGAKARQREDVLHALDVPRERQLVALGASQPRNA
jgi:hypothetical protein